MYVWYKETGFGGNSIEGLRRQYVTGSARPNARPDDSVFQGFADQMDKARKKIANPAPLARPPR